jgi:hypothetical protein
MTPFEPQPTPSPPPRFQFTLRTLLLLAVVLASSLAVFGAWGIVVFAVVSWLAACLRRSSRGQTYLALAILFLICLIALAWPAINVTRESSRRFGCSNRLHQIGLAVQNYNYACDRLPPAYIAGSDGKPMHSWRVLILPFMEYDSLYKGVDLTQPWDVPQNKKVLAIQLHEFECPSDPGGNVPGTPFTSYLAVVGPNAAWAGEKPRKLTDFSDNLSSTIMLVEVGNSGIPWMEPRDLSPDDSATAARLPSLLAAVHPGGRDDRRFFNYDYFAPGIHVLPSSSI